MRLEFGIILIKQHKGEVSMITMLLQTLKALDLNLLLNLTSVSLGTWHFTDKPSNILFVKNNYGDQKQLFITKLWGR